MTEFPTEVNGLEYDEYVKIVSLGACGWGEYFCLCVHVTHSFSELKEESNPPVTALTGKVYSTAEISRQGHPEDGPCRLCNGTGKRKVSDYVEAELGHHKGK